jgi:hypothetical protein
MIENPLPDGATVPAGALYGGQTLLHPFDALQFETPLVSPPKK